MANVYSDHFTPTVVGTYPTARTAGHIAQKGLGSGAYKLKRAAYNLTGLHASVAAGDILAFAHLNSGDRLFDLLLSVDTAWTATTAITLDLGLYETNGIGDVSTVIDLDLFTPTAIDLDSPAAVRSSYFGLSDWLRGQRLWELAGLSADPAEQWIVAGTVLASTLLTAAGFLMMEVRYKDD